MKHIILMCNNAICSNLVNLQSGVNNDDNPTTKTQNVVE